MRHQAHPSEIVVGRITRKRQWDRRYRTPQAIRSLPVGPPDTRIPAVRLANYYLATALLWAVLVGWFVTNFMEGGV